MLISKFESLTRVYENKAAYVPQSRELRGGKVENIHGLPIMPVLVSKDYVFGD
jgi:hypothetical protein